MRNLLITSLAVSSFVLAGCPDGGRPDTGESDAGARDVPPSGEAGPNDDARPGDATAEPDAELDAGFEPDAEPPPDMGPQAGPVIVRSAIGPGDLLQVVFHNPLGEIVSSTVTKSGEARENLVTGSMVTIYENINFGKGTFELLQTIVGVEPGDVYITGAEDVPNTFLGDLQIFLPGEQANASYYLYNFGCGMYYTTNPTTLLTNSLSTECTAGSTTSTGLLAIAYDATDTPLAYTAVADVDLGPAGNRMVMMPPWQTAFIDLGVALANIPANAGTLDVGRSLIRDGVIFYQTGEYIDFAQIMPAMVDFSGPMFGDTTMLVVTLTSTIGGSSSLFEAVAQPGPAMVDLTQDLLPVVFDTTVTSTMPDPARPTIGWTPVAVGHDAQLVSINTQASWNFLVPPGTRVLRVPALPEDYAHLRPSDEVTLEPRVQTFEINTIQNYREFRRSNAIAGGDLGFIPVLAPGTRVRNSSAGTLLPR